MEATARAPNRVAILAGGGKLPLAIAECVGRRGGAVHIVAIEGEADAAVAAHPHTWVNLGQASRMLSALRGGTRSSPDNTMVIAGAVTRPDLLRIRPDIGLVRLLPQVLRFISAGGDDALLTRCIRLFESEGLHVSAVSDVAPELVVGSGQLGRHAPSPEAGTDFEFARGVLDALAPFDIGQSIVVRGGEVIAIEGVEGTDRMLARAAGLVPPDAGARRGVLVKLPKVGQERRVDLPTIGPRTISGAATVGLAAIGVAAADTIMLDRDELIETADAAAIAIEGLRLRKIGSQALGAHWLSMRQLGRVTPRRHDLADAARAADAVTRAAAYRTGGAAAVVRRHVLAVAAAEGPLGMAARVEVLGQWGLGRAGRKRGAIAVRADCADRLEDLIALAARAGFAGVGIAGGVDASSTARRRADETGLFLLAFEPAAAV